MHYGEKGCFIKMEKFTFMSPDNTATKKSSTFWNQVSTDVQYREFLTVESLMTAEKKWFGNLNETLNICLLDLKNKMAKQWIVVN